MSEQNNTFNPSSLLHRAKVPTVKVYSPGGLLWFPGEHQEHHMRRGHILPSIFPQVKKAIHAPLASPCQSAPTGNYTEDAAAPLVDSHISGLQPQGDANDDYAGNNRRDSILSVINQFFKTTDPDLNCADGSPPIPSPQIKQEDDEKDILQDEHVLHGCPWIIFPAATLLPPTTPSPTLPAVISSPPASPSPTLSAVTLSPPTTPSPTSSAATSSPPTTPSPALPAVILSPSTSPSLASTK
ncbi:hypothetical protein [Absidia glauca]|uniref:Uncharacterized protein n=1 Tax=Absidia glauca TaxID=4829 RepID=A0A168RWR3_ABSGL|nr:hypothetical protein [Absidia glauca]